MLLVPLDDLASTSYEQVLPAKIVLVGVAAGLAYAARRRVRRTTDGPPFRLVRLEAR
ncbi:hypothetical protein [Streptomyces sp. NPDC002619]|uniref:hypothetical protein n=1 Tax=Streptomyces sp. NPDC002619 TaxID=3364655 RepID=UPI0036B076D6